MKRVFQELSILGVALLMVVALAAPASALYHWELDCESGPVFTWQAIVTDSAGNPIPDGEYQMVYCYYEDSLSSNLIGCCTTYATVGSTSKGSQDGKASFAGAAIASLIYAQPIWEDTTKAGGFFMGSDYPDYWMEITFEGETTSPLTRVTSVPNAGTSRRMVGDLYTAPGRALVVNSAEPASGAVDLLADDSTASLTLYRPNADTLPGLVMRANDFGSTVALLDEIGATTISLTSTGAGTFDDTLWSKTGFKFPDGSVQTTAATGGGSCWDCPVNYVYLHNINDSVGIGTTTPIEKLEVVGNLRVTGKASIGPSNTNSGSYAFVAGVSNSASGDSSVVSGGANNIASGTKSTVGGGHHNTANNGRSVVSGGYYNTASGFDATVAGGTQNTASGTDATVGGGGQNSASGQHATVSGGKSNTASGIWSTVGGGNNNETSCSYATVGGGHLDTSKAIYGGVFSGYSNLGGNDISDTAAYVGGGYDNSAIGAYSAVGGGRSNTASGYSSAVAGGISNTASSGYSTVGGGWANEASGIGSATVSGGNTNTASGGGSTVSGGVWNAASGDYSTVGGGLWDTASGDRSLVGGGIGNTASALGSIVCGGEQNSTAGDYSVIPGGYTNTLTSNADYSMAFGRYVGVNNSYRVVFFDSAYSGRLGINRDNGSGGISYPIHVGTDGTNGNGAYLSNGGTWTNGSSREFKENFKQLDGKDILDRIDNLSMESWEYKGTGERHIWPCAEDFHEQFDVGVLKEDGTRDNKYLAAGDIAGVALVGVQELYRITQELQKKTQEIEELRAQLGEQEQLKGRVAQLEALVELILAQQRETPEMALASWLWTNENEKSGGGIIGVNR